MKRRGRSEEALQAKTARIAAECIAVRLRIISRRVTNIYNRELRPLGLTIGQMNILVVVFRRGPAKQQDVSEALHMEKSTMSRDVTLMCARGWMTKSRGDDGRATILTVTATGKRLLERTFPAWRRAQARSRALLGDAEVASLSHLADPRRAARAHA